MADTRLSSMDASGQSSSGRAIGERRHRRATEPASSMVDKIVEAEEPPPRRPGAVALFVAFATVALSGFGGVLPWTRRMIVERRRWMTPEEFNDSYALCNFLPGPNVVNFAVVFGDRIAGLRGAAAALVGLLAPPVAIVLVLGALYAQFGNAAVVRGVLAGVAPAAAGLMIATAIKMSEPLLRRGFGPAQVVVVALVIAVGVLRWPLAWVVLAALPLSIALAWWWRR
jgi:chromate transporter